MLQQMFVRVHARYECSPYAEDLASFAYWLDQEGYALRYAQRIVFRAKQSLERLAIAPGCIIFTEVDLIQAFRHPTQQNLYNHARISFKRFLAAENRLKINTPTAPHTLLRKEYLRYLSDRRGLTPGTINVYDWVVKTFMKRELPEGRPLSSLTTRIVERHIEQRARELTREPLRTTVLYLQAFLRYCYSNNLISSRFDRIDQPVSLRATLPPRALDWELVQEFLRSIDRRSITGWRDYMMLHLIAYYGLRPGEVARLTLDSIDWEAKTMLVLQSKTCSPLILPLLDRTIDLLKRYLRAGRRKSKHRELFLCAFSPDRPITNFAISQVFKIRARKSGLPIAHATTYSLRHTFAMRLLQRGVGIKAIGDLMGHNSIASTAVYLRLHTEMLRDVALPVPGVDETEGGGA
jgi:integrase